MSEALYARGIAVGGSDIKTGTITFRHRARLFTFDASDALSVAQYNGYFYEATVKELKALERRLKGERHGK